jgi:hypothetical protein
MEIVNDSKIENKMGRGMGTGEEENTKESEGTKNKGERNKRKEARKQNNQGQEDTKSKEQNKFFVDVSKDAEARDMILNLLGQANKKEHGREIILKDLVLVALPKLTPKDVERIQENCLTPMEKIQREWTEYNKKNSLDLSFDEFLVKKLGIN